MFYEFETFKPVVDETAFVHETAVVIGNVTIGKDVYVGPGAVIRGDWGEIIIKDGCNIQENCVIHMFPGITITLDESAHIGHGAIIHGAQLGKNCLIGMNAVVMDNAVIGKESIIGALSFVPEGMEIPRRKIAVGNPAKIIKDVSEEMLSWKSEGTKLYQKLPAQLYKSLNVCEPLREKPKNKKTISSNYNTWKRTKK